MGKLKVEVSREKLEKIVRKVEKENPVISTSNFCDLVSKEYSEPKVTKSVVLLRLDEFNIKPNISKPKRNYSHLGRSSGPKSTRADKFKSPMNAKILDDVYKETPTEYKSTADKLKNGSMVAAIKLKCLDCTCYNKKEIKYCVIKTCPLYLFRPYK